jgi:hypothetical protein
MHTMQIESTKGPRDAGLFFVISETHCERQITSVLPDCPADRGAQSGRHYLDNTKPEKKE